MPRPFVLRVVLALVALLTMEQAQSVATNEAGWMPLNDAGRIQALVDEMRNALALEHQVAVALVPSNPMLVSVEAHPSNGAFLLSLEDGFVGLLNDDELRAVVAHELGHVWIFTHHPYLQTEQLANRIAMRVVSRDSLERVYGKVWERNGSKGDLARFLGH